MIDASALQLLLMVLTGWLDRRKREALAYLVEENRVVRPQLGGRRLRLTASRRALVIIEQSTQSRATTDPAFLSSNTVDQLVPKTLMIPLAMIVSDELGNGAPNVALADWNHPVEALLLDRSHEPFGVGIGVGRLERRLYDAQPSFFQHPAHVSTPFAAAVANQNAMVLQPSVIRLRERATNLVHEQRIRMCRGPDDLDAA